MFKLKNYQENHISELEQKINEFLNLESDKICIFKSPTGSGKTIMIAELIERLANNRSDGKELVFIWISVHKLHDQSKKKLKKYYEDLQIMTCSFFMDLQDHAIQDKEILFFNWSSINQTKNIYIRDNENKFNLTEVIKNTKNLGREIILIIDESHHTATSDKSRELINKIKPKITIEVSATPKIKSADTYNTTVELQEVKDEEMIKKTIHINSGLSNDKFLSADEVILKSALEKRTQLLECYKKEKSNVNPLILIQLPNSNKNMLDKKDNIIKLLDTNFNINTNNGKLAIYLSSADEKVNLQNIEKNNNTVEVLIFKQAITVGWDCPRSSILVLFRDWQSFEFSIQTIGRIMRMPEIKYYDADELNHAYVYTNMGSVQIAEDISKDYLTVYESSRRENQYDELNLSSIYFQRKHAKTALDVKFREIFLDVADKNHLAEKISITVPKFKNAIIKDAQTERLDMKQILQGDFIIKDLQHAELTYVFDQFAKTMTEPFAQIRSFPVIKRAIYRFFESATEITDLTEMANIVMSEKNEKYFMRTINESKELFTKEVVKKIQREKESTDNWNVPKITTYTKNYGNMYCGKHIMFPNYIKIDSNIEKKFMQVLESKNNVKWWFKNGVNDKKYFAIEYVDLKDDEPHSFYVDFILYMNDGRIGLFDTKSGYTAENDQSKSKAESLSKYIADNKNKKLFGGITIFVNGEWLYNDRDVYDYDANDFSDWEPLVLD